MQLRPGYTDAQLNLAELLIRRGNYSEARDLLRQCVSDSGDVRLFNALAWLLATAPDGLRDGAQAVKYAEQAAQLTGGHPQVMATLAAAYAECGRFNEALATAKTARQVADTDKDLLQHNGISQRDENQAQTDAANAEADRDAALQGLVALNIDPKAIKDIQAGRPVAHIDGFIRSPIAGTVVEKLVTPGQLLQAGTTPCFTVADLSRVWIVAQVFGSSLASVGVGDSAEVQTGIDTKNFTGKFDNISALVDSATRSVGVRVVVDNPGYFLKKQMYVRVLIRSAQESTGMLVPISAILRDDENLPFVYIVRADGSFARAPVTQGYRDGDQVDITEGLHSGDQIVVDGGLFVQFMQNQ